MKTKIPAAFWDELRAKGLIEQEASVPAGRAGIGLTLNVTAQSTATK